MRLYEISGEAAQAVRCAVTSPEGTRDLHCLRGQKIRLCLWGNALEKAPVTVPKRNLLRDRGLHGLQQTTTESAQDTSPTPHVPTLLLKNIYFHRLSWEQGVGFCTVMLAVNLIFNDGET